MVNHFTSRIKSGNDSSTSPRSRKKRHDQESNLKKKIRWGIKPLLKSHNFRRVRATISRRVDQQIVRHVSEFLLREFTVTPNISMITANIVITFSFCRHIPLSSRLLPKPSQTQELSGIRRPISVSRSDWLLKIRNIPLYPPMENGNFQN
jgi:hypothetical protein